MLWLCRSKSITRIFISILLLLYVLTLLNIHPICRITDLLVTRMLHLVLRFDLFYRFSSTRRTMNGHLKTLHNFTDSLIRRRRNELLLDARNGDATSTQQEPTTTTHYLLNDDGSKRKQNFVDILLHAQIDGRPLSNLDIREEVDTFMFEGHDTTTSAITFCLYNIAKYATVQRRCVEEIRRVMGGDRAGDADAAVAAPTMGQLNSMPYMDLVIKETLRLFPAVPVVGRIIEQETTISEYRRR